MINNQNKQTPIKHLDLKQALTSHDEVVLGYTKDEAINEASRCLNCKNPKCVSACPLHNNIPLMNMLISEGKFEEANTELLKTNPFSGICSRVCQHEKQCEGACIRGNKEINDPVAIGFLERFVFDNTKINSCKHLKNKGRIAIIGSGPSGLACANYLIDNDFYVEVFEKEKYLGGILQDGIPEFVLPKTVLDTYIKSLKNKGVIFNLNKPFNNETSILYLLEDRKFDYIYFAIGYY